MNGADGIDARILAFVLERFPFARQRKVAPEDSLLESGIVDSLGVLELVDFLETTFGSPLGIAFGRNRSLKSNALAAPPRKGATPNIF